MGGWPYNEDDNMEIGGTGWVPVGEGLFRNKYTGHIIDEFGVEYNEDGEVVSEEDENE